MSGSIKGSNRPGPDREDQPSGGGDYEVGYGKPPKATQFKKGQRANPNGRPKKSLNIATIMRRLSNQTIVIREGGIEREVPRAEALLRTIWAGGFKGDPKHTASLIALMARTGMLSEELTIAGPTVAELSAQDREILATFASSAPGNSLPDVATSEIVRSASGSRGRDDPA